MLAHNDWLSVSSGTLGQGLLYRKVILLLYFFLLFKKPCSILFGITCLRASFGFVYLAALGVCSSLLFSAFFQRSLCLYSFSLVWENSCSPSFPLHQVRCFLPFSLMATFECIQRGSTKQLTGDDSRNQSSWQAVLDGVQEDHHLDGWLKPIIPPIPTASWAMWPQGGLVGNEDEHWGKKDDFCINPLTLT